MAETLGVSRTLTLIPLATAYLSQGKYAALIETLEPTDASKADAELWLLIGEAHLALGQLPEAEQAYQRAAEQAPDQAEPMFGKGRLLLRRGDLPAALAATSTALKLAPDRAGGWRLKGTIQHAQGSLQEALDTYAHAITLEPQNLAGHLARIAILMDLDRPAQAAALAQQSQQTAPQDPRFPYLEAVALARTGNATGALQALQVAAGILDRLPDTLLKTHSPSVLLDALVHFSLEHWEQAYTSLQRYSTLVPDHPGALKLLGSLLLAKGDLDQALEVLESTLRLSPHDPVVQSMLGEIYSRKGQYVKADDVLSEAVKADPHDQATQLRRALNNLARGNETGALEDLGKLSEELRAGEAPGMVLVVLYLQRQDHAKALAVAGRLANRFPDHQGVLNLLGIAQTAAGDIQAARHSFEQALNVDPTCLPAQINLGKLALLRGQYQDGEQQFSSLLHKDPKNVLLMMALADALEFQDRTTEAIHWLDQARRLEAGNIPAAITLTDLLIKTGDAQRARQVAQEAELEAREDPRVMEASGRAELALGKKPEAQIIFRRMSTDAGYAPQALHRIASLQFAAEDPKGAMWSLRKAIDARPDFMPSWTLLVNYLLWEQQPDKARDQAEKLRQILPREPLSYQLLGDIALHESRYPQAISFYQQAQAIQPDSRPVVGLARAYLAAGDEHKALHTLQDWSSVHPEDILTRQAGAEIYLRNGEWALAKREYEAVLQLAPRTVAALNNLAYLYTREDLSQALDYARQAYTLEPKRAPINDTLGWILVRQGKASEGLKYLRDATALAKADPETHFHLAVALHQLGRFQEAAIELDKALQPGQVHPWTQEANALLKQLP